MRFADFIVSRKLEGIMVDNNSSFNDAIRIHANEMKKAQIIRFIKMKISIIKYYNHKRNNPITILYR